VNRGEVWWAEHPDAGRRPYLILTRAAALPMLHKVAAVPATRRIRSIPSELRLDEDDGMPGPCALNFDSLAVMPKGWFVEPICQLSSVRMVQACRALAVAMGC
jgi:mRNA-degrading endonuclease toxin of MazEF toxin-antitoxin module